MSADLWPPSLDPDARASGSLELGGAGVLLGAACRAGATGALLFERQGAKKIIGLRGGAVLFARSNVLDECLGRRLVAAGLIAPEDRDAALSRQEGAPRPLGETLVASGKLRSASLQAALEAQMQARLQDLVGWSDGAWLFVPRPEPAEALPLGAPLAAVLHAGLLEHVPPEGLHALLPRAPAALGWAEDAASVVRLARELDPAAATGLAAAVREPCDLARHPALARLVVALGWTGHVELRGPEGEAPVLDPEAVALAWAERPELERLGLSPEALGTSGALAEAHRAAVAQARRELASLEATAAGRRVLDRLLVALDDAERALAHPDVRRRLAPPEREMVAVLGVLEASERALAAMERGDLDGRDAALSAAAAIDAEKAAEIRRDPAFVRFDRVIEARSAGTSEAWAAVLELDPDHPEALREAPAPEAPSGLWRRLRGS